LPEAPSDHSTISRTRRLIDLETHLAVFTWILQRLADAGLVKGKTVGIDATTLEANASRTSNNNPLPDGIEHDLRRVVQVELLHQIGAVGFDGGHADVEQRGDLFIRAAFREELQDFALTVR
jgi:hypothetical protein